MAQAPSTFDTIEVKIYIVHTYNFHLFVFCQQHKSNLTYFQDSTLHFWFPHHTITNKEMQQGAKKESQQCQQRDATEGKTAVQLSKAGSAAVL